MCVCVRLSLSLSLSVYRLFALFLSLLSCDIAHPELRFKQCLIQMVSFSVSTSTVSTAVWLSSVWPKMISMHLEAPTCTPLAEVSPSVRSFRSSAFETGVCCRLQEICFRLISLHALFTPAPPYAQSSLQYACTFQCSASGSTHLVHQVCYMHFLHP